MSKENKYLCSTCTNSIRCNTWAEWKCKKLETRIRNNQVVNKCEYYSKRSKGFKEPKCQCEDCLKNELLFEEDYDK